MWRPTPPLLFLALALAFFAGCGGSSSPRPDYAPAGIQWGGDQQSAAAPAAPEAAMERDSDGVPDTYDEERPASKSAEPSSLQGSMYSGDKLSKSEPSNRPPPPPATASAPAEQPIIVYAGFLRLRVKRLIETIDAITAHAEKLGGYIESMTAQVVIVRVPVATFDGAMKAFEVMGTVLQREVKSLDVTARFTDMSARLAVAVESRKRLLALLATTEDVQQRLRILEEIKRLSEQIETIQSTLGTLRKLADFSTITLALEPVMAQHSTAVHRSPFGWIRNLQAHQATLTAGKSKIGFTVPKGFVLFEEDDLYRAQAADTSTLRAATVDNEPKGDAAFWLAAIDHEMIGRDEEPVLDGTSGALAWRIYRSKDAQPRFALIGVLAAEDKLLVLEGFFPTDEAYNRHREALIPALGTFQAK